MNHPNQAIGPMDIFGSRIAARLDDATENLPYDIAERLRAARVRAVDRRKWVLTESAGSIWLDARSGTLMAGHGSGHPAWWDRLGAAGLFLTLVLGLFIINAIQDDLRADDLADIDTALLTDELPPAAYVDPGFMQFLKSDRPAQ